MSKQAFEKIHNIDSRFNKIFHWPLFMASFLVTAINYLTPYSVRLILAFLVNIFFNRPYIYVSLLGKFVGEKMNYVIYTLFYLIIIGCYSLAYQFFRLLKRRKKDSNWVENNEELSIESCHLCQSRSYGLGLFPSQCCFSWLDYKFRFRSKLNWPWVDW